MSTPPPQPPAQTLADAASSRPPDAAPATEALAPTQDVPLGKQTDLPPAVSTGPAGQTLADPPPLAAAGPLLPEVAGYEVLGLLGKGGMGVVYQARQKGLGRVVALKMILHADHAGAADCQRFRAEAEAIARLQHPHIVQVFEVGEHKGAPYFSLEFCPGGSLEAKLRAAPLPPNEAAALVETLARAMHAAHQAGVVHRDLKPANVLLAADGAPKVTDFGLAKKLDEAGQTQSGAVLGTPSYMAPEQAAGQGKEVGPAADVYALGAILYDCLTGRPPFQAAAVMDTLRQVLCDDPPPPSRLKPTTPRDLEAIVLKCLEKDRALRYATAAALADDLGRWRRGEPVVAHRQGLLYRLGKRLRKHRRKVLTGAVAAGLLSAIWLGLADAGYPVPGAPSVQQWLDRHEASLFRPAPSEAQLRAAAADQRRALRQHLLGTVMSREGWIPPDLSTRGHTDAWTQLQTTAALFAAGEADGEPLRPCANVLDRLFEPNGMCEPFIPGFGWPNYNDGEPSAESSGWALSALALVLKRPGLAPPAERDRLLRRLDQVQTALDDCRSRDPKSGRPNGGWNLFAQQDDPGQANVYITVLVCQGLLELRRADLPWHDSRELRDRLLAESLDWLLRRFDGRGWSAPSRQAEEFNDGLTLHIFTALLRAEADGLVELPKPLLEQIPRRLAECRTRPLNYQIDIALFSVPFHNHVGKAVPRPQRPVRMLWHPWALSCAALWMRRCERTAAPHDEIVRTRRVLGHLVLTLGDAAVNEAKTGYTYVVAETLLGLTSLDPP